ncbi:hypothetical protein [Vibrio harveyi]|uniref:hypothetical protein n=1 Tax=Vibrio harveyi TaxID=669 RepID=UPI00037773F7|nr:hypothetical protein [Vibrio harveyi]EGR0234737.1 hypothetical protein [Vibrio vulnificus]ELF6258819.1 hypothetical protein [Vibrio vulnificus]ELH7844089.1 hypothetical protein [Vibrio vulnificus]MCU8129040.1 hypothetical protein [Vibrio vulnificus]MCU8285083.1 hypothetical protein [Vibrio vulnificus]
MDYKISLFTFFLGLFLGHRFTLERDKRKEFNAASEVLREKVFDYLESNRIDCLPTYKELELFSPYVKSYKRKRYLTLINQIKESCLQDQQSSFVHPVTGLSKSDLSYVSKTKQHVKALNKYIQRK